MAIAWSVAFTQKHELFCKMGPARRQPTKRCVAVGRRSAGPTLGFAKVVFSRERNYRSFVPHFRDHTITSPFSPAGEKVADRPDEGAFQDGSVQTYQMAHLPTSYFLLPTSYFLLPTSYFLLPTSYFLLPTSYFLLPTSYCLLPTAY